MSIIVKGNNISSTNNGITPNEATNILFSQNSTEIRIVWESPKDVTINGVLLSKFDHLIIVRKQDSVPLTPTDGTIVYNGSSTSCKDTSVVSGNSYYYRFFVYDSNKNINNSANMIFKQIYNKSSSIKNLSWKEINEISESGKASSMFNIGDEIDVNLSEFKYDDDKDVDRVYSFSAQTVTLQIWDFDHFDRDDKNCKAGIVFGMKILMKELFSGSHFGCWAKSEIKEILMDAIYDRLPEDCRSYIKPVKVYTSYNINYNGYGNPVGDSQSPGNLSIERVFVPGLTEVGSSIDGNLKSTFNCELNQKHFPIFTDANSRKKTPPSDGSTNIYNYLLRSSKDYEYNGIIRVWNSNGEPNSSKSSGTGDSFGLCFCFCI